jgi:hypothetical protein
MLSPENKISALLSEQDLPPLKFNSPKMPRSAQKQSVLSYRSNMSYRSNISNTLGRSKIFEPEEERQTIGKTTHELNRIMQVLLPETKEVRGSRQDNFVGLMSTTKNKI